MVMCPSTVAVDGPVAAGKTAVSRSLASRLDYRFVDTGAMYRAVAWQALRQGVGLNSKAALSRLARRASIAIYRDPSTYDEVVRINGHDVSKVLRSSEIDRAVPLVAQIAGVRKALVALQRRLAEGGRIVMAGRDIGTVVLPDADLKVFLVASLGERSRRRYDELKKAGYEISHEDVTSDLLERDKLDSERPVSPVRPALGAIVIDTSGQTVEGIVGRIMSEATFQ